MKQRKNQLSFVLICIMVSFQLTLNAQVSPKRVLNDFLKSADFSELDKYWIDCMKFNPEIQSDTNEVKKRYASFFVSESHGAGNGNRPYLNYTASTFSFKKMQLRMGAPHKRIIRKRNLVIARSYPQDSCLQINMTLPLSDGTHNFVYFKVASTSAFSSKVELCWILIYDEKFSFLRCERAYAIF